VQLTITSGTPCNVIYDVRNDHSFVTALLIGAAIIAAGVLTSFIARRHRPFGRFALLFIGVLWTSVAAVPSGLQTAELRQRLRSGRCDVTSGVITSYVAPPTNGKGADSFDVADESFSVSETETAPGFHWTRRGGSPLRNGTFVRITSAGGVIVRVETCASNAVRGEHRAH
jgi:hypothetical protein